MYQLSREKKSPVAEVASVNLKFKKFALLFYKLVTSKKRKNPRNSSDNKMLIFDDISTDELIKLHKKINSKR